MFKLCMLISVICTSLLFVANGLTQTRLQPLADPTLPKQGHAPASSNRQPGNRVQLTLNAILFNATSPLAIVNNTTVAVGDSINGLVVTAIHKNGVALENAQESLDLALVKPEKNIIKNAADDF